MFDKWIENARKKIFGRYELELQEAEDKGEKRWFEHFLVKIAPKLMSGIMIFLGLAWIFNKIFEKYGLERLIIVLGIIIILTLRSINKTLNRVS